MCADGSAHDLWTLTVHGFEHWVSFLNTTDIPRVMQRARGTSSSPFELRDGGKNAAIARAGHAYALVSSLILAEQKSNPLPRTNLDSCPDSLVRGG